MSVTLVIVALIFGWGIFSYNRLVRDKVRVETGWSDISVQLKRRHDLIPKLVTAVKQYAAYESATLETVTAIRAQERDAGQSSSEEQAISIELKKLIALAEQYPDLKANQAFLDLQKNLSHVEQHLQYARRYYNGAVRNLNIRVDSFPDTLIARAFNFTKAVFFEFDAVAESAE
ncbi:MAG: LemA family protein [Gammaproteobacteria bacterium]